MNRGILPQFSEVWAKLQAYLTARNKKMLEEGDAENEIVKVVPAILSSRHNGEGKPTSNRALNKLTMKNNNSLPIIDELKYRWKGETCFLTIELRGGYHQVLLHPEDV